MDRPEKRGGNRNPAPELTDDLVVEILSRFPVKSVCRFKCVSRHWRDDLIAHPVYRAKLPQTLTGFFCHSGDDDEDGTSVPDFVGIAGKEEHQLVSPSLSFLPHGLYRSIVPKHCSNGLLVCLCWKVSPRNEADYVVCNPATQQWVTLPGRRHGSAIQLHLAVDRASSSGHFHLFAILEDEFILGVDIYSSKTGAWSHKGNGWVHEDMLYPVPQSVFLNGVLFLVTRTSTIIAVDAEGTMWDTISVQQDMDDPTREVSFIGESQGRVHYVANRSSDDSSKLSVWILNDKFKWIRKYNINTTRLFGAKLKDRAHDYCLVAIHPECNIIFFTVRSNNTLMSYHMDRREVRVLGSLNGLKSYNSYLPYVPSFRVIAS